MGLQEGCALRLDEGCAGTGAGSSGSSRWQDSNKLPATTGTRWQPCGGGSSSSRGGGSNGGGGRSGGGSSSSGSTSSTSSSSVLWLLDRGLT